MKLYMDESGNGNPGQPLIVGAVETEEEFEDVESRVRELYEKLSARRSLAGLPSFEEFRLKGFHATADPVEIKEPFLDLMRDISFKAYIFVTDGTATQAGNSELEKLEFMYGGLLGDLLLRHKKRSELVCHIEQNDSLKSLIRDLPKIAEKRAYEKLGRVATLPRLNIVVAAKTEAMSMAIIDYVMLAVSRWVKGGRNQDPKDWSYRAFRDVEPFISVLYSLEGGVIAGRKRRLH